MKVWEAIQMLEQMDKTKECTLTFGEVKLTKPFGGLPLQPRFSGNQINHTTTPSTSDYILNKENWPASFNTTIFNPDGHKDSLVQRY